MIDKELARDSTSAQNSPPTIDVFEAQAMRELAAAQEQEPHRVILNLQNLKISYGKRLVVDIPEFSINEREITTIMGPSGCGKSTTLRAMNRIAETDPAANIKIKGSILYRGEDIYRKNKFGRRVDPVIYRRKIGMVFQSPNPFPTMSIYENVTVGYQKILGWPKGMDKDNEVERVLREVDLWDEVKDKLDKPGDQLSGGQKQRLCIARAILIKPDILLMDEPCSALDDPSTFKIEDLMKRLSGEYTIVLVTHRIDQVRRVADKVCFMSPGEDRVGRIVEQGSAEDIFQHPQHQLTELFIGSALRNGNGHR